MGPGAGIFRICVATAASWGLATSAARAQVGAVSCPFHSYPQRTNQSLAVDPTDDRVVYVGIENEGFFKTTDGGVTWSRIVQGIKAYPRIGGGHCYSEFFTTVVDPRNPRHVCFAQAGSPGTPDMLVAANHGVYCSEDGGATWEQRVGPTMNTAIYALAIDPTDSQVLYAGCNANSASNTGADADRLFNTVGVVYKTRDGGRTWTELPTGFVRGTRVTDIRVDPENPATVYASTFGLLSGGGSNYVPTQFGVLRSFDGGASWTAQKQGLGPDLAQQAVMRLDLSPSAPRRLIVAVANGSYFLSADGAESFARPASPSSESGIVRFDPTDRSGARLVGLSQVGSRLVESRDGGNTWSTLGALPADTLDNGDPANPKGVRLSAVVISHQDPRIVYLSGSHASVYRSTDGGATWVKVLSADRLPQ